MRQDFYLRFNKYIRITPLCIVLSEIAYCIYVLIFISKKICRKKRVVNVSADMAINAINEVYPENEIELDYSNPPINNTLDLSIIITVYNFGKKLSENAESFFNQKTKYNFEIIFINDGSTDNTASVLESFLNRDNVKIINQKNGGASAARNKGISCASGKYIMFIDCDDTVSSDLVETLMDEAYSKNYDIVMTAHNYLKIKDSEVLSSLKIVYPNYNLLHLKNGAYNMNYPGFPWGKVYKREMFNNVRFPEGRWYEDSMMHILLYTQCQSFSYIQKPLYNYLYNDCNTSNLMNSDRSYKKIDCYWLLIELLKQYDDNKFPRDKVIYMEVLRHVSQFYYPCIKDFDENLIEALYVLGREIAINYKIENTKMPYVLKQVEKAFETNDIELWKLASQYQ